MRHVEVLGSSKFLVESNWEAKMRGLLIVGVAAGLSVLSDGTGTVPI